MAKILEARAVLSGEDKVSPVLDRVSKKLQVFQKSAKTINDGFGKADAGWGSKFQAEIDKMGIGAKKLESVRRAWERYNSTVRAVSQRPATVFPALDAWKSRTISNLRAVAAEEARFAKMRDRWAGRAGAIVVGYGAQRAARKAIHVTAENQREGARDYMAGLTDPQSKEIGDLALNTSAKFPSVDQKTMHDVLRETRMSTRSMETTKELADTIGGALVSLQSLKGKDQAVSELTKFFKGLDTLGKNIDPDQVKTLLGGFIKGLGVQGKDLNLADMALMSRYSKSAGAPLSNRFITTTGIGLMGDMGASSYGTALGSALSQTVGGRATKASKEEQKRWGLRDKKGNVVDQRLLLSDPDEYVWKNILPKLKERKIDPDDDVAVAATMAKLFSAQKVADLMTKLITQRAQYQAMAKQFDLAPGIEGGPELRKRDPFVAMAGFTSQVSNLVAALSNPVLDAAAPRLNALTDAIARFTASLPEHKEQIKGAVEKALPVLPAAGLWGAGGFLGWLGRMAPGTITGGTATALGTGASFLGGASLMFGWHAAGVAERERIMKEWKATHGDKLPEPVIDWSKVPIPSFRVGPLAPGDNKGVMPDGAYHKALRQAFEEDRARQNLPPLEGWPASPPLNPSPQQVELKGSADVKGEVTVKVEVTAGSELLRAVESTKTGPAKLSGTVSANGPGSLGTSMPDTAAAPIGAR